jgi:hypothetical protein
MVIEVPITYHEPNNSNDLRQNHSFNTDDSWENYNSPAFFKLENTIIIIMIS